MKKWIQSCFGIAAALLCPAMTIFPVAAAEKAAVRIDLTEIGRSDETDTIALRLWQLADTNENGGFVLRDDFADAGHTVEDLLLNDADTQAQLAEDFSSYVSQKKLIPLEKTADTWTIFQFSDLDAGIYLLGMECVTLSSYQYTFSPVIFGFPYTDEDGQMQNDLVIVPKCTLNERYTDSDTTTSATTTTTTVTSAQTETTSQLTTTTTAAVTTSMTTVTEPGLPQTGMELWKFCLYGGCSLLCVLLAFLAGKSKKRMRILSVLLLVCGVSSAFCAAGIYRESAENEATSIETMQNAVSALEARITEAAKRPDEDPEQTFMEKEVLGLDETPAPETAELTVRSGGNAYLGVLEIPAFGQKLPVADVCDNRSIAAGPGRYAGGPDDDCFVIGAHNYATQFGTIGQLTADDTVLFRNVNAETCTYRVVSVELAEPAEIERVCDPQYDLALFTCNRSGRKRIVVFCQRTEPDYPA